MTDEPTRPLCQNCNDTGKKVAEARQCAVAMTAWKHVKDASSAPAPLGMSEQVYHQIGCASLMQRGPCDCKPVTITPRAPAPPEQEQ